MPTPPHPRKEKRKKKKKKTKFPDSGFSSHVEQTMFPEFGWFRAGSLVGFPTEQGGVDWRRLGRGG